MSIRDMVNYIREGTTLVKEESLLDTHAKYHGTPEQLPDIPMTHHKFGNVEGYGHPSSLDNIPHRVRALVPNATSAHTLYGPHRFVLHSPQGSTLIHNDEPEFHTVEHTLVHNVQKFNAHEPVVAKRYIHLHSDTLHTKTYHRQPEESADVFAHRIHTSAEHAIPAQHNDMNEGEEGQEHYIHTPVFQDPLEAWHNEGSVTNEPIHAGYSGSHSYSVSNHNAINPRHNSIHQDFSHYFKVKT